MLTIGSPDRDQKTRPFHADLHIHVDRPRCGADREGQPFGVHPEALADKLTEEAIAHRLDVAALLAHNRVPYDQFRRTAEGLGARFNAAERRAGEPIHTAIQLVLGREATVRLKPNGTSTDEKYHVTYLFEDEPASSKDEFPWQISFDRDGRIPEIEDFRAKYSGIVSLCHVVESLLSFGLKVKDSEFIQKLLASPTLDGYELVRPYMSARPGYFNDVLRADGTVLSDANATREKALASLGVSDAYRADKIAEATTRFESQSPGEIFQAIRTAHTKALLRCPNDHAVNVLNRIAELIPSFAEVFMAKRKGGRNEFIQGAERHQRPSYY